MGDTFGVDEVDITDVAATVGGEGGIVMIEVQVRERSDRMGVNESMKG
jgi:hypothetical protein